MSEIKFKAWDKELGIFTKPFDLYSVPKLEKYHKVVRYTGLKDKHGVEIYEGDIVAHEVNNMRGAVVWNPASYCYSIDSLDGSEYIADLCDYDWNPEVIGNIYENPELLTLKKDGK